MNIVARSQWANLPPARAIPTMPLPAPDVWLHHGASGISSVATARAYLRFHIQTRGWSDIGYSFIIAGGQVLEGRGPGRQGAHTQSQNHRSHGICVAGDYTSRDPSPADLDAVVWLLRHGHQRRWWRHPQITGGHRNAPGASTTCPGRLQAAIPDINRRARLTADQEPDMTPAQAKLLADTAAAVARIERRLDDRNIGGDLARLRRTARYDAQAKGYPVADGLEHVEQVDA